MMRKRVASEDMRVLVKLSGEALCAHGTGFDADRLHAIAEQIKALHGYCTGGVALVVGGGNLFRGASGAFAGLGRAQADDIGMLATVMNALALQGSLVAQDVPTRVQSALKIYQVCEPYVRSKALKHLAKGRVVILAAGTGNPYFTTDSAAALRAAELGCQVLVKATKVNGIYDRDPERFPDAQRLERISYDYALQQGLKVMDASAFALCQENDIRILVGSMFAEGGLRGMVDGSVPVSCIAPADHGGT